MFLFCTFLFSINTITAQYGNNGYGNNGNGYGNGYGNNRGSQMNQMNQNPTPSAPKPVPAEKTAAKIVDYYKKELTLDSLQELVLNNIFTKALKAQEKVEKQEMNDDDKLKEYTVLAEMTDLQVMEILNKEQKGKYQLLKDEQKSQMARKR